MCCPTFRSTSDRLNMAAFDWDTGELAWTQRIVPPAGRDGCEFAVAGDSVWVLGASKVVTVSSTGIARKTAFDRPSDLVLPAYNNLVYLSLPTGGILSGKTYFRANFSGELAFVPFGPEGPEPPVYTGISHASVADIYFGDDEIYVKAGEYIYAVLGSTSSPSWGSDPQPFYGTVYNNYGSGASQFHRRNPSFQLVDGVMYHNGGTSKYVHLAGRSLKYGDPMGAYSQLFLGPAELVGQMDNTQHVYNVLHHVPGEKITYICTSTPFGNTASTNGNLYVWQSEFIGYSEGEGADVYFPKTAYSLDYGVIPLTTSDFIGSSQMNQIVYGGPLSYRTHIPMAYRSQNGKIVIVSGGDTNNYSRILVQSIDIESQSIAWQFNAGERVERFLVAERFENDVLILTRHIGSIGTSPDRWIMRRISGNTGDLVWEQRCKGIPTSTSAYLGETSGAPRFCVHPETRQIVFAGRPANWKNVTPM